MWTRFSNIKVWTTFIAKLTRLLFINIIQREIFDFAVVSGERALAAVKKRKSVVQHVAKLKCWVQGSRAACITMRISVFLTNWPLFFKWGQNSEIYLWLQMAITKSNMKKWPKMRRWCALYHTWNIFPHRFVILIELMIHKNERIKNATLDITSTSHAPNKFLFHSPRDCQETSLIYNFFSHSIGYSWSKDGV